MTIVQVSPTLFIIVFSLGRISLQPKQSIVLLNCIRLCTLAHAIPTCSVTHSFTPMKMAIKYKRRHYM